MTTLIKCSLSQTHNVNDHQVEIYMYTIIRNPMADFNDLFDSVFNDDFFKPSNTVKSTICSNNFPPSDLSFGKNDESYIVDIALPGYSEDDISIGYENGFITVKGNAPKADENKKYAKKGIKVVDTFTTSFAIDILKYDIEKLKATMVNGILTIIVPVKKDFINSLFCFSKWKYSKPFHRASKSCPLNCKSIPSELFPRLSS